MLEMIDIQRLQAFLRKRVGDTTFFLVRYPSSPKNFLYSFVEPDELPVFVTTVILNCLSIHSVFMGITCSTDIIDIHATKNDYSVIIPLEAFKLFNNSFYFEFFL